VTREDSSECERERERERGTRVGKCVLGGARDGETNKGERERDLKEIEER